MQATLRLITVWVSVTVVIVALGWSFLHAAVTDAMTGDTDGFTTLNQSALRHRPGTAGSGPVGSGVTLAPTPLPQHSTPAAVAQLPPRPPNSAPAVLVPPSSLPTPRRSAIVTSPPTPSPTYQKPVADDTTTVSTDGGVAVLRATDGVFTLDDCVPAKGFSSRAISDYDGSLIVEFTSADHLSEVHAYFDEGGVPQITVEEKDRPPQP